MDSEARSRWGKILGAAALVGALFLVYQYLPFQRWAAGLLEWLRRFGPFAPLVCILAYVIWVICLLPGSIMTLIAGVLFGMWGFFIAFGGGMTAAMITFLLARHLFHERAQRWLSQKEKVRLLDRAIQQNGWTVVLLARLSPVIPYNITNYLFGVTSVSFPIYVAATALGTIPGTLLYVYAGSLGHQLLSGERPIGWWQYLLLTAGLAATLILGFFLQRKIQAAAHAEGDGNGADACPQTHT